VAIRRGEGRWLVDERPCGLLVADQVIAEPDLEAVLRARVPGRHGRVVASRAARILDAPGAAEHQPREGLAGVDDELQVRTDVEHRDGRVHLVTGPARRLAIRVTLALAEQS